MAIEVMNLTVRMVQHVVDRRGGGVGSYAGRRILLHWRWTRSNATSPTSSAGCAPRHRNVRKYLVGWLVAIGCTFVGFWLGLTA